MTHLDIYGSDESDAAQILRQYKDRIERLEQKRRASDSVQLVRDINETVGVTDTVTVTEKTAAGFVYGTSQYGRDGWGDDA